MASVFFETRFQMQGDEAFFGPCFQFHGLLPVQRFNHGFDVPGGRRQMQGDVAIAASRFQIRENFQATESRLATSAARKKHFV